MYTSSINLNNDDGFCKNCGSLISKQRSQDPEWNGDTCSEECAQELEDLEVPWEEFNINDDYLEYTDEDLVPEDDRED